MVVALAFVPSTLAAIHDVRDADRARTGGRVVRRGRLLRQIVPVLELGPRTRGHARRVDGRPRASRAPAPSRRDRAAGWWGVASLLALGGAFVALVGQRRHASPRSSASAARSGSLARDPPRVVGHAARALPAAPHDACADWLVAAARSSLAPVAHGDRARSSATAASSGSRQPACAGPSLHVAARCSRCSRCSCRVLIGVRTRGAAS